MKNFKAKLSRAIILVVSIFLVNTLLDSKPSFAETRCLPKASSSPEVPAGLAEAKNIASQLGKDKVVINYNAIFRYAPPAAVEANKWAHAKARYYDDFHDGKVINPLKINGVHIFDIGIGTDGILLFGGNRDWSPLKIHLAPHKSELKWTIYTQH